LQETLLSLFRVSLKSFKFHDPLKSIPLISQVQNSFENSIHEYHVSVLGQNGKAVRDIFQARHGIIGIFYWELGGIVFIFGENEEIASTEEESKGHNDPAVVVSQSDKREGVDLEGSDAGKIKEEADTNKERFNKDLGVKTDKKDFLLQSERKFDVRMVRNCIRKKNYRFREN